MKSPLVSVIIVTYNSEKYIKACMKSVLANTYGNYEIIVVDNDSSDKSLAIIAEFKKKSSINISLVQSKKNLGYAAANNLGVKKALGKHVFIVNPDTVVSKNFLQPLVKAIESDGKIAAAQPIVYLLNDRKTLNLSGKVTHFLGFDWMRNYLDKILPPAGEITSFSGSGVLLRKSIFNQLKGFDEKYFMYYEDTDLSWRIRLLGYKLTFVPESVIYHDYKYSPAPAPAESQLSFSQKFYFAERNRLLTILKNYSSRSLVLLAPAIIFMELGMIAYSAMRGLLLVKLKGYLKIIFLSKHLRKQRTIIQQQRKLKDSVVVGPFASKIEFMHYLNPVVKYLVNPVLYLYWAVVKNFI